MSSDIIIRITNLTKRYGKTSAIAGLSLEIRRGEVFGLEGPNGAGKSTLVGLIATIITPDSGEIVVNGLNSRLSPGQIKKMIGFVPQEIALYSRMNAMDNLVFWGRAYGLRGAELAARVEQVLAFTGLKDRVQDRVSNYSGGMQRRLNVGAALLHQPEILIMDEPTAGLDTPSRQGIVDMVRGLAQAGTTVIYVSHYPDEMSMVCDRIAVLNAGKLETIKGK